MLENHSLNKFSTRPSKVNLLTVPFPLCCSTKIEGHHHFHCFLHSWLGHVKIYFVVSTGSRYTKNTCDWSWQISEFLFMLFPTSCIEVQVNNATKKTPHRCLNFIFGLHWTCDLKFVHSSVYHSLTWHCWHGIFFIKYLQNIFHGVYSVRLF